MIAHKLGGLAAVASLSLVLVSGGLYASWSDSGQVTGGANVGTFGCELSSETAGAVISPDRKSVTYAEPAIQSSVVGDVATLSVDVHAVGSIPARVHWLYSTTVVPGGHWAVSEGTPSITTDVTINAGESKHYDDLGFVVSLLDNDDIGRVQSVTYTANCAEVPPPPTNVSVPDVIGLAEADAVSTLTGAGLALGSMTEAFSASVPAGRIISTSPTAGASVPPGTAVDCVKSKGVELVAVPDVVGKTYANATSDVTGAGLASGSRTDVYSDTVADGRVISTNPSAGAMVAPGTTVNYVVSKGAEPPPPPPVEFVGRTVGTQATSTITLPSGWQPGDLAIVVIMRNATATIPTPPSGYTGWAQATAGATTSQVSSRLAYRTLQAGDGAINTGTGYRGALVMVYRHAQPGVAVPNGGTNTTLTFPGLSLQVTNGSSWVGGMATSFNGNREATVAGLVNRTSGNGSTTGPGGFDTDGGVTAFTSRTISSGQPWNAYSFELKRNP